MNRNVPGPRNPVIVVTGTGKRSGNRIREILLEYLSRSFLPSMPQPPAGIARSGSAGLLSAVFRVGSPGMLFALFCVVPS